MRIAIVVFDGFDELDAIGPYEVFRHAARRGADLQVSLVTLELTEEIVASGGLRLRPHGTLDGVAEAPDVLLIPGGPGTTTQEERGDLPQVIRALHKDGTTVATVCTGAMLAAAAGITAGRRATTHHAVLDELQRRGADVVQARVVDDGDLVTSGGVTCGLDLALWLVELEFGAPLADTVAQSMAYQRSAAVVRAGGSSTLRAPAG